MTSREGDVVRDGQLDFGPAIAAAPDSQTPTDSLGALSHPREAPVAVAALAQDLLVDAAPIVAYADTDARRLVRDRQFDLAAARVPQRIDQRFAADAMNLIADERMHRPHRPLD